MNHGFFLSTSFTPVARKETPPLIYMSGGGLRRRNPEPLVEADTRYGPARAADDSSGVDAFASGIAGAMILHSTEHERALQNQNAPAREASRV